jgi:hypothetical protein
MPAAFPIDMNLFARSLFWSLPRVFCSPPCV